MPIRILLFALILLEACQSQLHQDIKLSYFPGGNIRSIRQTKNGVYDGESIWYHPNGRIREKTILKGGRPDGAQYVFYQSGAMEGFCHWHRGTRVGQSTLYHDDTLGIVKAFLFYDSTGKMVFRKNFDRYGNELSVYGARPYH
jgi:antitoxin component YwqK of YwqJK toxin-antitoxin module